MRIWLEVYLRFRGASFWKGEEEVPVACTPPALLRHLGLEHHPELTVIVNGRHQPDDRPLQPGDQVAVLRAAEGG